MKKVLLTGCAGFIGYHTTKRLLDEGVHVVGIDNMNDFYETSLKDDRLHQLLEHPNFNFFRLDVNDNLFLERFLETNKFDVILHLAAQANVRDSLKKPFKYIELNIRGMNSILEAMHKSGHKKLVYASSSSIYGNTNNIDEPISPYGMTKRCNEIQAFVYNQMYGIEAVGLRYFTVYGEWGRPDMAIYNFSHKIRKGEEITIFNNGEMLRDFTYIDDIVDGTIKALHYCFNNEIAKPLAFDLGKGNPDQLMRVVEILSKELGKEPNLKMLPMQPGEVFITHANITKAQELLGYEPTTPIDVGIPKFIKWYKEYYTIK